MTTGARPLRVLQVAPRYYPDLGGTETHVHEIVTRLVDQRDLSVTVFASDRSGLLPRTERAGRFDVIRRRAWPTNSDLYLVPGLVRVISTGGWDVVHFQGIHTFVPIVGMLAARRAGIPYVVTFHTGGHSSGLRQKLRGAQWRAVTPLLRSAARLIAVSRFERSLFINATGLPDDHFVTIRNGGSLPHVAEDVLPVPGRMVSSGRLEQYKGHHRVIEALPLVRRSIPAAHLVILGSGPYESELRGLAARLGMTDFVSIRQVPPGDRMAMSHELLQAQVLAALSDYEAHPVAVMEALTLGVPVVAYDIAGTGDLVADGVVRGLAPWAPASVAAKALVEVITMAVDRDPRGAARCELPSWEGAAAAVAGIYRDVTPATAASRRPEVSAKPRPRVVHVITTMVTGGAERQLELLATDPAVAASVICLYELGPVGQRLRQAGVTVTVLGMRGWRKAASIPRLALQLRQLHPDIVHVHLLSAQLWGIPAARLAGIPVVVSTEHSLMEDSIEGRPTTRRLQLLYRGLEALTSQTIAVAPAVKARLSSWGVPGRRISVVPNAVDTGAVAFSAEGRAAVRHELGIPAEQRVCGIVGRLDPVKRQDVALDALAEDLRSGRLHLLVVGEGERRPWLVERATRLGVAAAVTFTGAREDIGAVLSAMDVLLSPSRDETFGVAVVEALASGLPVVYEQAPAIEPLSLPHSRVRQIDAELAATREEQELRAAVIDLASAPRGIVGDDIDRMYSVAAMRAATTDLYRRLLLQPVPPAGVD